MDTTSPLFSWRVKILETVARCKCCVIMLDIGCEDLVLGMFNTFFSAVRSGRFILHVSSIGTHYYFFFFSECSINITDFVLCQFFFQVTPFCHFLQLFDNLNI